MEDSLPLGSGNLPGQERINLLQFARPAFDGIRPRCDEKALAIPVQVQHPAGGVRDHGSLDFVIVGKSFPLLAADGRKHNPERWNQEVYRHFVQL